MTLWSAAGISVAAAAVSLSGGSAGETLQFLANLCLSGPAETGLPKVAAEFRAAPPEPSVSMGLSLISAALITGGLWPGEPTEHTAPGADPDRVLAAMAHVASATGGISPPEFAAEVTRVTGRELSVQEAALALRTYRRDAAESDLSWIAEGQSRAARDEILSAALGVGWTHGEFTPGGLEMIGRLARAVDLSGDDLALLFWEATETPVHARTDPLARLRPKSRMVVEGDAALA